MDTIQLQNNQVVQTTTVDLTTFVTQQQEKLNFLKLQADSINAQMQDVIAKLSTLITPNA